MGGKQPLERVVAVIIQGMPTSQEGKAPKLQDSTLNPTFNTPYCISADLIFSCLSYWPWWQVMNSFCSTTFPVPGTCQVPFQGFKMHSSILWLPSYNACHLPTLEKRNKMLLEALGNCSFLLLLLVIKSSQGFELCTVHMLPTHGIFTCFCHQNSNSDRKLR